MHALPNLLNEFIPVGYSVEPVIMQDLSEVDDAVDQPLRFKGEGYDLTSIVQLHVRCNNLSDCSVSPMAVMSIEEVK